MSNRFAILNLDEDSDVEKKSPVKIIQTAKDNKIECRICHQEHWTKNCMMKPRENEKPEVRQWNVNAANIQEKRTWQLDKNNSKPSFHVFSKDNVFQQPHQKKYSHHHSKRKNKYMFQEEDTSIPLEVVKNPTPEKEEHLSANESAQVPELFTLQESTLADKIKKALEKQENQKHVPYQDISGTSFTTLKFNRVISLRKKD